MINDFDVDGNVPVNITWLPPDHYGVAYIGGDGVPYFVRVEIPLFEDGFESGDTSHWSATVP